MNRRLTSLRLTACTLATAILALIGGCGDKIAIPEPTGLFGISVYREWARFAAPSPLVDLAVSQGRLFTLTADALAKRNLSFSVSDSVGGLAAAGALCVDEPRNLVFVWEGGLQRVSWYAGSNLAFVGATTLTGVDEVVAMATNDAGIRQVPGASTYLYLADPAAGVIHRYAYDVFNGLTSYGILARSDGDAARFVHVARGMVTDSENRFLVCDADSTRNWVIRFNARPDTTDTTPAPGDEDPLRGVAFPFRNSDCVVAPASDFVLGFAAACGEVGWEGRPGSEEGEFDRPSAVAVDGLGRIFVADTGNDRVQIFSAAGEFTLQFGSPPETPGVTSIGVYDHPYGSGAEEINFGAFVFVLLPGENQIRKFISSEHADYLNEELPPPPN